MSVDGLRGDVDQRGLIQLAGALAAHPEALTDLGEGQLRLAQRDNLSAAAGMVRCHATAWWHVKPLLVDCGHTWQEEL